jgi:hypothetical protein
MEPTVARKKSRPPTFVSRPTAAPAVLGVRSATSVVPASEPSLFQSSRPVSAAPALK